VIDRSTRGPSAPIVPDAASIRLNVILRAGDNFERLADCAGSGEARPGGL
jgi:hypothetical protein